jgi:hypothetical protein
LVVVRPEAAVSRRWLVVLSKSIAKPVKKWNEGLFFSNERVLWFSFFDSCFFVSCQHSSRNHGSHEDGTHSPCS